MSYFLIAVATNPNAQDILDEWRQRDIEFKNQQRGKNGRTM